MSIKSILFVFFLLITSFSIGQNFSTSYEINDSIKPLIRDVSPTSDGGFIVGFDYYEGSYFSGIAKINNYGLVSWAKSIDDLGFAASCSFEVIENSAGNYLLMGLLSDTITGKMSGYISELESNGNLIWTKKFTPSSNLGQYAINRMEILPNNDILYMLSVYSEVITIKLNSTGDLIWGKSTVVDSLGFGKNPGFDTRPLSDGTVICSNKRENTFSLVKYDSNGNLLWNREHQLGTYSHIKSLVVTASGDIYGSGYVNEITLDAIPVLLKIDPSNGDIIWIKKYEIPGIFFMIYSGLIDDVNNLILTYSAEESGTTDQYIYKIDYNGIVLDAVKNKSHISVTDYNLIKKMGANDYIIAGQFTATDGKFGYIERTNDLFASSCIMEPFTWTAGIDFTAVIDTVLAPIVLSDFNNIIPINLNTSDVILKEKSACLTLQAEKIIENFIFKIFPNPSNNNVYLNIDASLVGVDFILMNLIGEVIYSGKTESTQTIINTTDLTNGIYFVSLKTNDKVVSKKIIVSH